MQQMIVNVIVAAAFLFLARWLFKSFASRRGAEAQTCNGCGTCESAGKDAPPAVVRTDV
jgi:hypothetical protein